VQQPLVVLDLLPLVAQALVVFCWLLLFWILFLLVLLFIVFVNLLLRRHIFLRYCRLLTIIV